MSDAPLAVDPAPHVGESRRHRLATLGSAHREGVCACVQVGIVTVALDGVRGDSAVGDALEELHEALDSRWAIADELRGGGEEGEVSGGVERGNLFEVLLLESIIPNLEIFLVRGGQKAGWRKERSRGGCCIT